MMSSIPLLKIGTLCKESGVSIKTIRYYEELGLIHATERTEGGFRLFATNTLYRLAFIKRGQRLGLSLQEIGRILSIRDSGEMPCRAVKDLLNNKILEIEERILDLRQLQTEMQHLLAEAPLPSDPNTGTSDPVICPILQPSPII